MRDSAIRLRTIITITVLAGAGEFLGGLLLVLAPAWTLSLMKAPAVHEPVFVGFIGCFVSGVGLSYLWGLAAWSFTGSLQRLRTAWEITIIFRILAGSFVLFHVIRGTLASPWLSVPLTDWLWVIVQALLIHANAFGAPDR